MRPEPSHNLLGVLRSKAKMHEYLVPEKHHIALPQDPAELFILSISFLGDQAARISREEIDLKEQESLKNNLIFSARFFDSYLQAKLEESLDPYLMLLGSASYYLCDLPGSASVLAKSLDGNCPKLGGDGLENLLLWLLQADLSACFESCSRDFGELVENISQAVRDFFEDGSGEESLLELAQQLRLKVYDIGSPRQLLLGDIIVAILNKKIQNSCWTSLPKYSGLSAESWSSAIKKDSFIKELWPAQHLLGQKEVLKGKSAVVQMPTSAGKTKAIELILRSAFLADRAYVAVIVAPFRALCHEIKNNLTKAFRNELVKIDEFSDVLQMDILTIDPADIPPIPDELLKALLANFDMADFEGHKQVIVVTPEKLLYVLRHAPVLASHIGLVVFDEGHQFDSDTRGITYELLLTSLRTMIPPEAQKVVVSAVISNAESVGEWLNGDPNVVKGRNLNPTFKSVGFASWLDSLGRIEYVDSQNIEQDEFFVPRIIESMNIGRKLEEKKDQFFPDKKKSQDVALYLGLKLVANGSIAIFCGQKATASKICKRVVEIYEHQAPVSFPQLFSDHEEVRRLADLHVSNLGPDAASSKSARLGIFAHHGNTPHGIRLAVEHAMREGSIRFVVCTSTLAEGVNLPLRYLIVTNFYQRGKRMKVRDFHNLIGRAGRAGMHTEGTILFSDPDIYDKRKVWKKNFSWKQAKTLLDPDNSEPCISNLLSIFDSIVSEDKKHKLSMDSLEFARLYIAEGDLVLTHAEEWARENSELGFSEKGIKEQMIWKIDLICAVESFLLAHWDETEGGLSNNDIARLAESTLAFFLAEEQQKENIKSLFELIGAKITKTVTEPSKRRIYGRTLYGIQNSIAIETWLSENYDALFLLDNDDELIDFIWPIFSSNIKNKTFNEFDKPDVRRELVKLWVAGKPFSSLLEKIQAQGARLIYGSKRRSFNIEQVVDICERGLAFDGALFIGAISEMIELLERESKSSLVKLFHAFQKRMKYGLPSEATVLVYELGFADRVIAQKVAEGLGIDGDNKRKVVKKFKKDQDAATELLSWYPTYFQQRMEELIADTL